MRTRSLLLAGVGALICATPALAQQGTARAVPIGPEDEEVAQEGVVADPAANEAASGNPGEIVVSGSRIDRAGFVAPSPTVVIGAETLEDRAAVNVADVVNEIPSFRRTQAPEGGGIGNSGTNNVDLRGLGPVRVLVLLDRMRLPAVNQPGSEVAGATDLNLIPSALIGRIDAVTGGASAAYGSDAIAGVLNMQLNTRLEGLKGNFQYGQTRYDDALDYFGSLAWGGSFAGDRGRIIIGGEFHRNEGTDLFNNRREWGRRNATFVNFAAGTAPRLAGLPAQNYFEDVTFGTLTPGGLISPAATLPNSTVLANPAPLRNLQFVVGPNGTVTTAPFDAGLYQGLIGTNMVGGTGTDPYQVLRPQTQRYNLAAHAEYEIADGLDVWARGLYSNNQAKNIAAQIRGATGGTPNAFYFLSRNNPYLQAALTPAQLALIPTTGPASGLRIGYLGNDFGATVLSTDSTTYSVSGGIRGQFGGTWRWDGTVQYGVNRSRGDQSNSPLAQNFLNAIDAVLLNGQIVCASAAARADGCQPINILGRASYTPEAYNYVFKSPSAVSQTTLFEANANINGEPFSVWAGPVSVGAGVEYREETFETVLDPLSLAGGFIGRIPANFPRRGQSVKEGYVEAIVPLLSEDWFTGSLEFNGAARLTDYEISGQVTTWKGGLVWRPIDDIMLRGTLSRDIRAPSLTELFTPATRQVPSPNVTDLRAAFVGQGQYGYDAFSGGNVNLKPEVARTMSFGAVMTPGFVPRLQLSADYYEISVKDAIGTSSAALALSNCGVTGLGVVDLTSPFCELITFANNDPINGRVLTVIGQRANFAEFLTRGIDLGASYMQPLDDIIDGATGRIVFNAQATHVMEFRQTSDINAQFPNGVNRAGQTGSIFGSTAGVPKWAVNASLAYRGERLTTSVQYRWVSTSHFNNASVGPDDPTYSPALTNSISNNIVPARGYVNFSAAYDLGSEGQKKEVYVTINNVLDQDPPLPAINNNAWYDILGRSYRVGIRFEM